MLASQMNLRPGTQHSRGGLDLLIGWCACNFMNIAYMIGQWTPRDSFFIVDWFLPTSIKCYAVTWTERLMSPTVPGSPTAHFISIFLAIKAFEPLIFQFREYKWKKLNNLKWFQVSLLWTPAHICYDLVLISAIFTVQPDKFLSKVTNIWSI